MLNDKIPHVIPQQELRNDLYAITSIFIAYMKNMDLEEIEIPEPETPEKYAQLMNLRLDIYSKKNSNGKVSLMVKLVKDDDKH